MNFNFCNRTILLLFLVLLPLPAFADEYQPKEFKVEVQTQGFPGAKAKVTARLDAPLEAVWREVLNANNHAGKYPRMQRAFCMSGQDVEQSKKEGLRNGATVAKRYKKKMCQPHKMRQRGKLWTYYLFQEFDYPFPLADRWIMAKAINDETGLNRGKLNQTGKLIYGRQDVYEFKLSLSRHPKYPKQTKLDLFVWSDPGGFIADWMVREATKYVAPKFMQVLEREGKKWAASTP